MTGTGVHIGVVLEPSPAEYFRPAAELDATLARARALENAGVDYLVLGERTDTEPHTRVGYSPILLAARLATATTGIGLVAESSPAQAEPFHTSIALATLDHVSRGRGGWSIAPLRHSPEEAGEVVQAVTLLWDSWDDDAEIRDTATGRFLDRKKLHRIDFRGQHFSIAGPSITPRPPQGHPVVIARYPTEAIPPRILAGSYVDLVTETAGSAATGGSDRILEIDVPGSPVALTEAIDRAAAAEFAGVLLVPKTWNAGTVDLIADALPRRAVARTPTAPGTSLRSRLGLGRPRSLFAPTTEGP